MQCSEGAPARSKDRACGGVLRQINLVIIDRASALCRRLDDTDEGTDALAHVVNRGMVGRGQEFRRRGGHPQRPARRRSAAGRARALGTWVGGLINRCLVASPNASTYPAIKSWIERKPRDHWRISKPFAEYLGLAPLGVPDPQNHYSTGCTAVPQTYRRGGSVSPSLADLGSALL